MRKPYFFETQLWSPDEKYSNHRIPGLLVTDKGTLLAYCEARTASSDWALMDIILQRSEDQGRTFGEAIVLASGNEKHKTVNNPIMMQDKRGRIHFLYCEDYSVDGGRVLRRFSDNDGISWSEPIDITDFTMPSWRNVFALGPGHGISTDDGTLVVPVWMVPKYHEAPLRSHAPSILSTLYSTDFGESWHIGEILRSTADIINPNEAEITVASDGRVYINARIQGYCRAVAYSKTGYSDWTDYRPDYSLYDPQCFGSVAYYRDESYGHIILFSNCKSKTSRTNVTVCASEDDGATFSHYKVISEERGGYTETAVDNAKKLIYVLYEDKFGITDHLAVFNYEWIIH